MEYADNGDLFQMIKYHQENSTYFLESDIWKIFIQIVRGLRVILSFSSKFTNISSAA